MRVAMVVVFALFLTACQGHVGSGPLTLSPWVKKVVEKRMADSSTSYIAVTPDGSVVGSSYCPAGFSAQCSGNDGSVVALNSCERQSKGRKCYLYAHGGRVIWDFDAPPPDDGKKIGAPVSLEMIWTGTDRKVSSTASWNRNETLGQFKLASKDAGLEGCAGEITRTEGSSAGRWQLYCASGQSYTGNARFDGDAVHATGSSKTGDAVSLKVERPN